MNGLAQMMSGGTDSAALGQSAQQPQPMRDLDQIVQMIKNGASPEELVQGGIPVELVQAAMEAIQKEAMQVQEQQPGAGLAQSLVQGQ